MMFYHNYKIIFDHIIQTMATYHNTHGDVVMKCTKAWNTNDGTSK
jgi:hypothetical protein